MYTKEEIDKILKKPDNLLSIEDCGKISYNGEISRILINMINNVIYMKKYILEQIKKDRVYKKSYLFY